MRRAALVLGLALTGCVTPAVPSPIPATPTPPGATPDATPPVAATATPSPTASARTPALDTRYGWTVLVPPANASVKVRRETEPRAIWTMDAHEAAVSPDGRLVAYWVPSGVRRELRVAPAGGGAERVLVRLAPDEIGNAHAWSTDGTGVAVQVDSGEIFGGGIDPPPVYSSIRTVDLATGTVKEIVRRDRTRLTPVGWQRARGVIAAYTGSPEGGIQVYHRITESGALRSWPLTEDFCVTGTVLRLDPSGDRVLSAHPVRCFDVQPGSPPRVSQLRVWPIDDADAATVTEFPGAWIADAQFRPRSRDIAVASVAGATLRVDILSDTAKRELASIDAEGLLGAQYAPVVFRPDGDVALVVTPAPGGRGFRGRLIDVASGAGIDVDLGGDAPIASVVLSIP